MRRLQASFPKMKEWLEKRVIRSERSRTASLAGGLGTAFLGGSSSGSIEASTLVDAVFLLTGPFAAGGAAVFEGPPAPALHLTVAFSYASFTFAFLTSANPSTTAFNGLSPTIFISVPKHVAASSRAPAKPSSRSVERGSVTDLT